MKNYFGKKVLELAGFSMAIILGCTACADGKSDKMDADVNQSVIVEKETEDTQENQYVNSAAPDKSDLNFFKEADLQGSVVEFSDSGFKLSAAEISKENGGDVMVQAAPGTEKDEDLISISYASDVTFEIIIMDKASLVEISREAANKESIKKQKSVLIFGSCQDTYHWTADKVIILRWM